jgi:hypothetical protein
MSVENFIADEVSKINATSKQGEQAEMVQLDMNVWAKQNGYEDRTSAISVYAQQRGWLQENINGMEIVNL